MAPLSTKIMKRVRTSPTGGVWTATDFLGVGNRAAVDQALGRLTRDGKLRRISRGLYATRRISLMTGQPAPVLPDAIVSAIARRDGIAIMPNGMAAANSLGLTNAVSAQNDYLTDGPSRTIHADGWTIKLRHARKGLKLARWADRPAAPLVVALDWLKDMSDSAAVALAAKLPADVKTDLKKHQSDVPRAVVPVVRKLLTAA